KRWIGDYAHLIQGLDENALNPRIPAATEVIIVYDKRGPDVRHAKNISSFKNVKTLNVDRAGHMVSQMLNGSGILGTVARALMQPEVNLPNVQALINRSKKSNAQYISELAKA